MPLGAYLNSIPIGRFGFVPAAFEEGACAEGDLGCG